MSKTSLEHKKKAPRTLSFAVVTISTSKYALLKNRANEVDDGSGDLIVKLLIKSNHKIALREIVPDDPGMIAKLVTKSLGRDDVDAIITTGGTGVTKNDVTVETVRKLVNKELPGFGEILRKISYDKIGSAAILTRAFAGVKASKAVFCLPGSPQAVEIAVSSLILPEAGHILKHSRE
ncbi:MAG: molybdenum cofactor biosynthesis protein B [Candidatus Bathyarchaeota archaeon]